jgi:hypothetical protein
LSGISLRNTCCCDTMDCGRALLVIVAWARRPSTAKLSDGSRYNYSVAFSQWQEGKGDVVGSFKASCLKAGIGVGYYYSLGSNGHFHGSPEELQQLELQQLTEVRLG